MGAGNSGLDGCGAAKLLEVVPPDPDELGSEPSQVDGDLRTTPGLVESRFLAQA